MKNYKIVISYDGTKYNGWQRQGNTQNTIQEKFEDVISKMCGAKTEIFASGRTDRGVHAEGQVANFKVSMDTFAKKQDDYVSKEDLCENKLLHNINSYLPEDIRSDSQKHALSLIVHGVGVIAVGVEATG